MNFLIAFALFIVSSIAVSLLLVRSSFRKKIGDFLLVMFSLGVGPFISGLIFYALLFIFPEKNNHFYSIIIIAIYFLIFFINRRILKELKEISLNLFAKIVVIIKKQSKIVVVIAAFFIGLYLLQLIAFPIVDNDSVLYLNQTEASYEYKNIDWQKKPEVVINGTDLYSYNSMIRPGFPLLMSSTYLFQGEGRYELASLKFVVSYYYILLLILFLFSVKIISEKLNLNSNRSLTYGLFFIVFSWGLTRGLIFSAKEISIYFFALFSILIATFLLEKDNSEWANRILLGILLGINSFINLHGIIIECIILLIIFLFSQKRIAERIADITFVFLLSIPFGGFELLMLYNFIFVESAKNAMLTIFNNGTLPENELKIIHQNLYQANTLTSEYLKGKLQILTNVGYFGFYFWIFLLIVAKYFKKIIKNDFSKVIIFFIFIYYVVVIDPLGFNNHPLSIVLWGSTKYAMLILFLGIILVSAFADTLAGSLKEFFDRNIKKIIPIGALLLIIVAFFYSNIINLGTKILLFTIPVFKDISFYRGVVKNIYFLLVVLLVLLLMTFILSILYKNKKITAYSVNIIFAFFVLVPFFVTNVGKVSFIDELRYWNSSQKTKMEKIINQGYSLKNYYKNL